MTYGEEVRVWEGHPLAGALAPFHILTLTPMGSIRFHHIEHILEYVIHTFQITKGYAIRLVQVRLGI